MTQPRNRDKDILARLAADPEAAVLAMNVQTPNGVKLFRDVAVEHQREWLRELAPMFRALAKGERPKVGRAWLEASKSSGKDFLLAALCLWLMAFTSRLIDGQVGAADKDQANELTKSARAWLAVNDWLRCFVEIQKNTLVALSNESRIEIVPADIHGSHGARPDLLIINEAHAISRFEFVQNMMDNATKVPHGVAIVATNAGHIGTEAWKLREIARTSPRWKFLQFDRPAPWLDKAELDEAQRRNSNERFKRLFWGVWSRGQGDALDVADVEASVDKSLSPMMGRTVELSNGRIVRPSFYAAIDLGIKHDRSALVVLAVIHELRRIRVAHVEWWSPSKFTGKVNLEAVEASVLAAHRRFSFSRALYDPWQAELMAQRLRKAGVPMEEMPFVGSNLNEMATTLLEVYRSRQIETFDCPRLTSDLLRLTIAEKSYGHKLEATRDADGHCDVATALAIALPAAVAALDGPGRHITVDHPFWRPQSPNSLPPPGAPRLGGFMNYGGN